MIIRNVNKTDSEACLDIYRWYVEHTAFSFEETAPDQAQFSRRIEAITETYPWLVYELNGKVLGYAYASSFRPRPAYRWSAEVTIYLTAKAQGQGIACQLYEELMQKLARLGYYNAIAVITEPNPPSEAFHRKIGFRRIGVFESIGYKLGAWHNVSWWQKSLQPPQAIPVQPGSV